MTDPLGSISDKVLRAALAALPARLSQNDLFGLSQAVRTTRRYSHDELRTIVDDLSIEERLRFGALYCMLVRSRHLQNYDEFRALVDRYKGTFVGQPAMLAMVAEAETFFAFSQYELRSALDRCHAALRQFDGVGLKLLTAQVILDLLRHSEPAERRRLLDEAESYVDDALVRYPAMPRYLAVKAQVVAERGRYSDARSYIAEAISREEPQQENYYIRLAQYEAIRSEIRLSEASALERRRLDLVVADFNQTRGSLIEIVGLLAAVLALVITGTQIATQVEAASGAGLLLVVGGVLLLSFAGYSALLGRRIPYERLLGALAISAVLVVAGLVFVLRYG